MDATLYQPIFLTLISMLCVGYSLRYVSSSDYHLQLQSGGWLVPFVLSVVLVFWLGLRPVSFVFGDTGNYASEYERLQPGIISMDWSREWIWQWLMHGCKAAGLSVNIFFLIVEAGYILTAFWAVRRFFPTNPLIGMLFLFSSLMFFTFGTNGLRNGLACHIVLLAISYLYDAKYIIGALFCLLAFGIHRSVLLPIAASVGGIFLSEKPKWALYFWFASIGISLVAGGAVANFFVSLGFDDRMADYTWGDNDMGQFSRTGFRWDFLLYSAFPVLLGWFVCIRRKAGDQWYNALFSAYCFANAFWIMVIRSAFSNRFAYLSWFLYPVMIAYPLINLPVWQDQDRKTGQILLAYCAFTVFMETVVW